MYDAAAETGSLGRLPRLEIPAKLSVEVQCCGASPSIQMGMGEDERGIRSDTALI